MGLKLPGELRTASFSFASENATSISHFEPSRSQSLPTRSGQYKKVDTTLDHLTRLTMNSTNPSRRLNVMSSEQVVNNTTPLVLPSRDTTTTDPTTAISESADDANLTGAPRALGGQDTDPRSLKCSTNRYRNIPSQQPCNVERMGTESGSEAASETSRLLAQPKAVVPHRDDSPEIEIIGFRSLKRSKIQTVNPVTTERSRHNALVRNAVPENGQPHYGPPSPTAITTTDSLQASRMENRLTVPRNDPTTMIRTINPRDLLNPPRTITEPNHTQNPGALMASTSGVPLFNPSFVNGTRFQTIQAVSMNETSSQELSTTIMGRDNNPDLSQSQKRTHSIPIQSMNKRQKTDLSPRAPLFAQPATGYTSAWSTRLQQHSGQAIDQTLTNQNPKQSMNKPSSHTQIPQHFNFQRPWSPANWSSVDYASLAQLCHDSFPFSDFCSKYKKSRLETDEVFSAIISIPILKHCGPGQSSSHGGLGEERVKERKILCKETREAFRKAAALEEERKVYERRVIRAEVEKEVLQRLENQGLLSVIGARMLLGESPNEGSEKAKDETEREVIGFQRRGRPFKDSEDLFGAPVKGKRGPKTKSVEDATAELTAASAELLKAKKAEERKIKLAEQRQMISAEEKEKRKEERKRKREDKKAEKATTEKVGGL